MGSGCSPSFMLKVKAMMVRDFVAFTPNNVDIICWTRDRSIEGTIDYRPSKWNSQKGDFELVFGHSAGSFPLTTTKAKHKIMINPPYPAHNEPRKIFRARGDFLVPKPVQDAVIKAGIGKNVVYYKGNHGTVPIELLKSEIIKMGYKKSGVGR